MIFVIAHLKVKPGTRDKCMAAAKPCIVETLKEKGCQSYELFASATDPEGLVFVERWNERGDLDGHMRAPHMKAWRAAGAEFIVSRKIEIIHPERVETL